MEQIKIIFEVAVGGFLLTLIQYLAMLPDWEVARIMNKINDIGNTIYKSCAAACVLMSGIVVLFNLFGTLTYEETKTGVASFLVFGLILLVLSYSFVPPKRILFIKVS